MRDHPHQLLRVDVGDPPEAWRAAGFRVDDSGVLVLGGTEVHCTGSGAPFAGWRLDGVDHDVDGLPTAPPPTGTASPGAGGGAQPNGISRIDHVVLLTGDVDRTVGALTDAGLELRAERRTTRGGAPVRQAFCWAGDVIVELVGPGDGEPTTDGPATVFGLALVADDLDATAAALGRLLGRPRDAIQPGRRIAGLRGRDVGIALPVAVMTPHPGSPQPE